jgi:hypothetical protein
MLTAQTSAFVALNAIASSYGEWPARIISDLLT